MSQPSDTPETRKPCRYCGCPEANDKDWAEIEPGAGEELGLCWDGEFCRHNAEAAIDRLISERDAAREDARRLAEAIGNMGAAIRALQDGELDQWDAHEAISNIETEALAAHEALTAKA